LEVETGYTTNEPVQMAVTEAIEKAVSTLVLEGIKDGIWADIPQPEIDTVLEKL
jgi:curli production assembly/transport component CsgG